jgi:hypothetical protein
MKICDYCGYECIKYIQQKKTIVRFEEVDSFPYTKPITSTAIATKCISCIFTQEGMVDHLEAENAKDSQSVDPDPSM